MTGSAAADAAPDEPRRVLPAARLADRPREARGALPAAGAGARALARRPALLEQAQDDATLLAIRDQERAGLDIVTDGEQRRESYSNRFATALDRASTSTTRAPPSTAAATRTPCRAWSGRQRKHPVQVRDLQFLQAHTEPPVKMTVPGPFTMSQQAQNDHYADDGELGLAYAAAVNDEIDDLFAAGADMVQIDEPYMQARPEEAREYGLAALDRALDGHRRGRPRSTSASATPRSSTTARPATRS